MEAKGDFSPTKSAAFMAIRAVLFAGMASVYSDLEQDVSPKAIIINKVYIICLI